MRSLLGLLLMTGTLAGAARPADAQALREAPTAASKQDAAAQHFQLGVEFYRAGDYAAARVEFEAAFGLSQLPDLLHNLSLTTEKQGQVREAIEYEERFLAAKGGELTTAEIDEARGRLFRLREQQNHGPQTAPTVPAVPAVASPGPASGVEPTAGGWRPPAGALTLLVGGGAVLVAGLACGGAALATGSQLSSGQAFTVREIEALTARGNTLNASAIALDIAGGVALSAGATWTIADWLKRGRADRRLAMAPGWPIPRVGLARAD